MALFWADQLAVKCIERAKQEKTHVNIKCQQTPSGGKHIGNLNDVLRAYYVCLAIKSRKFECEFVHTTDDRDPLKNLPDKVADLEGNWHKLDKDKFKEHLGKPLYTIPDPFSCCSSWSEHFTKVWMSGLNMLNINVKFYSVNKLYEQGKFDKYIETVFRKRKLVGKLIDKFQKSKDENYIPFDAICPKCGRLANIDDFDLKNKKVHFICGGKSIKQKKSEGCGYEGWVSWAQGKLQWRFEWPALWCIFNTTHEPFGKDHAEGSWPSGKQIMKQIFEKEPPIPFVYEFFLVDGKKMSASQGNVYIVQDIMKIIEPEVFMYYYTKRPEKQRDFELSNIYRLVDEFDEAEKIYFDIEEDTNLSEQKKQTIKRMYEMSTQLNPPDKYITKPSYAFCATLAQLLDDNSAIKRLRELGHVTDENEVFARNRLKLARYWINNYANESYKIKVLTVEQANQQRSMLNQNINNALQEFTEILNLPEKEQGAKVREICEKNGVSVREFFAAAYKVILGKDKGPRLIPFINSIDKKLVKRMFKG